MIRWMVNVPMRFQTFQPTMNTFPLNVKKKLWKYCVEESSIPSMHWWHRMWVIASVFIQNINRTLLCRREWRMRERKYLTIEQIKAMAFRVLSSFGSMCNIRDRNNIVCITLIWFFSLLFVMFALIFVPFDLVNGMDAAAAAARNHHNGKINQKSIANSQLKYGFTENINHKQVWRSVLIIIYCKLKMKMVNKTAYPMNTEGWPESGEILPSNARL